MERFLLVFGKTMRLPAMAFFLSVVSSSILYAQDFSVRGRVLDKFSRYPIPEATVVLSSDRNIGAVTDSAGFFMLEKVPAGMHSFQVSYVGYIPVTTPDYMVFAGTPQVEVELEQSFAEITASSVKPSVRLPGVGSAMDAQVISVREIEKSPGANRDVSRIVRSYPGVSFSPAGYRNDLIVRGGGPSENRFFIDGIEIPNINHFATQGASGGPVSILNADLVREMSFFTGDFPLNRAGGLSSVLDFSLKNGNLEKQTFKATLGASEVSLSGSGHFSRKTTWLFSVRQSYLQLLFKLLGLPFLPNYIDAQMKVTHRFSDRDEISFLALGGFDNMKLNTEEDSEKNLYLLSYLPEITQNTFTAGGIWKHYADNNMTTVSLSHSFLDNRNLKYRGNDSSSQDNLTLDLESTEQKTTLKAENRAVLGRWKVSAGAEFTYNMYGDDTYRRLFLAEPVVLDYDTYLDFAGWGFYAGAGYVSGNGKLNATAGIRFDGNSYSSGMASFWRRPSPRVSVSYAFSSMWSVSASSGLHYQLPPYTALAFRDASGEYVNRGLGYMEVLQNSVGVDWKWRDMLSVSLRGFYKLYGNMPLSLADNIPLACKGADYGTVGNEALVQTASGRSYGMEMFARLELKDRLDLTAAVTLYRSMYRSAAGEQYIPSVWDNRFIVNAGGTYEFPRHWSAGAKLSAIGGAPYTPYDENLSSLVSAWDASGRPYLDYTKYNTLRTKAYAQLDVRVDKSFFFRKWTLGLYLDLQNVTVSRFSQADALVSTGRILNPEAPVPEQRYEMKNIPLTGGTILPTLGVTVIF